MDISKLDEIEEEIAEMIESAAEAAIVAPFPDSSELETDVIL